MEAWRGESDGQMGGRAGGGVRREGEEEGCVIRWRDGGKERAMDRRADGRRANRQWVGAERQEAGRETGWTMAGWKRKIAPLDGDLSVSIPSRFQIYSLEERLPTQARMSS